MNHSKYSQIYLTLLPLHGHSLITRWQCGHFLCHFATLIIRTLISYEQTFSVRLVSDYISVQSLSTLIMLIYFY